MTCSLKLLACAILASSLCFGCSHPFLSSVEVKASPTIYAALGTSNYQLSSYVSASTVQTMLGSTSGATAYDYQDSTTIQKFLVHYPLTTVQLDFAQYLNSLNFGSTLAKSLTPGSFQVPSINQTQTQNGSFDLNAPLRSTVNGHLTAQSITVGETGASSLVSATVPAVTISLSDFSSATFASGYFQLLFAPTTGQSSSFTLKASKISLTDSSGNLLASSASSVDLVAGGTATIPLTNVTLPGSFKVSITATTSGGSLGKQDTITTTPSLSSDTTVSAAQGVNLATTVNTPAISVPVNTSGTLVSATIGTGSLTITQDALPAGWTGFTRSTTISLAQTGTGGLSLSKNGQTGNTIPFDLSGDSITANPIMVTASSAISATNASFNGLNGPLTLACTAAVNVGLFSSITVQPGSVFTPTQTFTESLGSQMLQWVQSITFSKIGMQFSVSNTLPTGNPMTIAMTSNALGITGQSPVTLPPGQTTIATFANTNKFVLFPKNAPTLDFTVTFEPQSYNPVTGQMTLYNITPGSSLSMGGSVTPSDTWTQAVVSPPSGGYNGTVPGDGSKINLSTLANYLGSNLTFKTIPAYLYVSGLPTNTAMTGQITAQYAKGPYAVLPNNAPLTMLSAVPTFPTGTVFTGAVPSPGSTSTPLDLSIPLNAEPSDLTMTYNLNSNSVTVTPSTTNSTSTFQADLVVIVPLSLIAAAGGATLSFDSSMPTTDLFGRNAGQDNSSSNKLLAQLTSLSLTINMTNTTGLVGTAVFTDNTQGFTKDLPLVASGQSSVTLTSSDIQHVINTVPFVPKLRFTIGQGSTSPTEIDIQRGGGIQATVTVSAVTDVDQTYNLKASH